MGFVTHLPTLWNPCVFPPVNEIWTAADGLFLLVLTSCDWEDGKCEPQMPC